MDIGKAIDILTEHNKWRRGEPPYDTMANPSPVTPKEIGEAIDFAVAEIARLQSTLDQLNQIKKLLAMHDRADCGRGYEAKEREAKITLEKVKELL